MKINKNTKWGDVDKDLSFLDKKEPMINKDIIKKLIFNYKLCSEYATYDKTFEEFEKEFDNNFEHWYKHNGEHFENDFNNS
tara:strand:- start:315 stop:557 length:243 start_codon:yes stop_codon:yes gene_type:complete